MSDDHFLNLEPSPAEGPLDQARWDTLRSLEDATGSSFISELVDVFLSDTPKRLAGLREGMAGDDARMAMQAAHSLKGSSSNIGAPLLESLAAELEGRFSDGSVEGVDGLVERLEAEADRVGRALEAERSGS